MGEPHAGPAAFALLGVWLLLLAGGCLVVWRELLVLRARVGRYGLAVTDGLDVGQVVPAEPGLPRTGVAVFVFGDCGSCHELAAAMDDPARWPDVTFVVGDGAEPGSSAALAGLAGRFPVVTGPPAEQAARSWRVNSGPLGLAVRDGVVYAKGYLRHGEDVTLLRRALGAGERSLR
jgi:hypothetical protein